MDEVASTFIDWFKRHGSQHASIGLTDFPGMGRGAIALDDIPVRRIEAKRVWQLHPGADLLTTPAAL